MSKRVKLTFEKNGRRINIYVSGGYCDYLEVRKSYEKLGWNYIYE